jgi:hypothetical protein
MKLSPYHLIIQHRPGAANPNGDFVSRYPIPNSLLDAPELNSIDAVLNIWESTNILQDIRSQQLQDPRLRRIIQILQEEASQRSPFGTKM